MTSMKNVAFISKKQFSLLGIRTFVPKYSRELQLFFFFFLLVGYQKTISQV